MKFKLRNEESLVLEVRKGEVVDQVVFDDLVLIDTRENVLDIITNELNKWYTRVAVPTKENIKGFLLVNGYCKEK